MDYTQAVLALVYAVEGVAQATAIIGYDIANGQWWQESASDRLLTKVGLVGSANGGDCTIEIFFGQQKILEYRNTLGGAAGATVGLTKDHVIDMQTAYVCKAGIPVHVFVVTQPATNPILFAIELRELRTYNGQMQ